MKLKPYWLLLIALITIFSFAAWTGSARKETAAPSARINWEYKTIRGNKALRDDELNALGWEGWELVLYDPAFRGQGSDKGTYYFKRPK